MEISLLIVSALLLFRSGDAFRRKRDLLDLADMFESLTDLDPTDYIPYGNWCGYGGGGKPIDRIDMCCHAHDKCYGSCEEECATERVHTIQYTWEVQNGTIVCGSGDTACQKSLCHCDKEVVACIAKNNHTYSESYRFIRMVK